MCCGHKDCESLVECAPTDKYCVITQASEYPAPCSLSQEMQEGGSRPCRDLARLGVERGWPLVDLAVGALASAPRACPPATPVIRLL